MSFKSDTTCINTCLIFKVYSNNLITTDNQNYTITERIKCLAETRGMQVCCRSSEND